MKQRLLQLAFLVASTAPLASPVWAQAPAPKDDAIAKIKDEGMNRSQVMKTLSYLTDVIGPRVTGTPALKRANEWTRDEMTRTGLTNAHLEAWGPFGRGWTLKQFTANTVLPQARPLEAYPKCWSPDVEVKDAEVVFIDAKTAADLDKYKGKLKGKVVLFGPTIDVKPHLTPEGTRRDEKNLLDMANADAGVSAGPGRSRQDSPEMRNYMRQASFRSQRRLFFQQEGVALLLEASRAGDGGNIFVQQATPNNVVDTSSLEAFYAKQPQPWDAKPPSVTPQLAVAVEAYNRMARTLAAGEKVKVSVTLKGQFNGEDLMSYNTVADLPGTDKKDEIVMLGGHLDSWHGGTGATDNAAGVAVCMEAVRILKAAGLQPRRTIRVALWSGEEQGLFGSEAYVKQHFGEVVKDKDAPAGSPVKVAVKPDWSKLTAYFNLDNGAGKIRGVYMQGNEAVRPIFRPWLEPFKDLGASTLTASKTGGTDHLSFDAVGLPGFQFIQDELEYDTRTHHSTQDLYDRAPEADMKQAATVMAAFIYNAAMRDEMLPRKPVQVVK